MKVFIVRGLPGSGKSTLAQNIAQEHDCTHIEIDDFFMVDGEYKFDQRRMSEAVAVTTARFTTALSEGRNVVIANTFTRFWEMMPFVRIARLAKAQWIVIRCDGDYGNVHNVPEYVIENMQARWQTFPGELSIEEFKKQRDIS